MKAFFQKTLSCLCAICLGFLIPAAHGSQNKKDCIILVTGSTSFLESKTSSRMKVKWQRYKGNIVDSIDKHCKGIGVRALLAPMSEDAIDFYARVADGLVLAGGGASIPPRLYGSKNSSERLGNSDFGRAEFEIKMFNAFLAKRKPVLGICLGAEIINVAMGGSLVQDLELMRGKSSVTHRKEGSFSEAMDNFHEVEILKGTLLSAITKENRFNVNSVHFAAIDRVGRGLVVSALAPDGVIEAIESAGDGFILGVQWHPEVQDDRSSRRIFRSYCKAVAGRCLLG